MFRDPLFDGAADPVVVWNQAEGKWFLFYTNRRANVPDLPGVSWVYGTPIGIAESADGGATWTYRGVADIHCGEGANTFWAPDVLAHDGVSHMFLTFVPGIHTDWSGPRRIVHLTSADLLTWKHRSTLPLASDKVIDASVLRLPGGGWRLFYNNEADHKSIYYADSPDLYTWQDGGKILGHRTGEGPKVFHWKERYWMIVDHWRGLGVYQSADTLHWTPQAKDILEPLAWDTEGLADEERVMGNHADVVISHDRAYLFYFTHPGRHGPDSGKDTFEQRRTSVHVVELEFRDGEIVADRRSPTFIDLQP